ncbi:hypothetical protein ACWNX6_00610 [Candidatus Vidania fulgoroideorum]
MTFFFNYFKFFFHLKLISINKVYFEEFINIISFLKNKDEKTILIKIKNNNIKFFYFGDLEIVYKNKINYTENISFSVEYLYIENIVKKYRKNFDIKIDIEKKNVFIKRKDFKFNSSCIVKNKKKIFKKKNDVKNFIKINSLIFSECLRHSFFIEKTVFVKKQGYIFLTDSNDIECFSTDGFRASFYSNKKNFLNKKKKICIEKELAIFINKIIKKFGFPFFLYKKKKKNVLVKLGNIKIYSTKFIKLDFEFKSIVEINKNYTRIKLDSNKMLKSLRKIDICNLKKNSLIKLKIKNNNIIVFYKENNISLEDKIPILDYSKSISGLDVLKVNFDYLKDFFIISYGIIHLYYLDEKSMIYLKFKENKNFLYCFMPIN